MPERRLVRLGLPGLFHLGVGQRPFGSAGIEPEGPERGPTAVAVDPRAARNRRIPGLGALHHSRQRRPVRQTDRRHGGRRARLARELKHVHRGVLHVLLRRIAFPAFGEVHRPIGTRRRLARKGIVRERGYRDRLRRTEQEEQPVEDVGIGVYSRPAERKLLQPQPAVVDGPAPAGPHVDEVDAPEFPPRDRAAQDPHVMVIDAVRSDQQQFPGLVPRRRDPPHARGRRGRRFFQEHVLAGLERRHRVLFVREDRTGHHHRVKFLAPEHLAVVVERVRNPELGGKAPRAPRHHVRQREDLSARLTQVRDVRVHRDPPDTDDANPDTHSSSRDSIRSSSSSGPSRPVTFFSATSSSGAWRASRPRKP